MSRETIIFFIVLGFLLLTAMMSLRCVFKHYRIMKYSDLKLPVIFLFLGPLVFQSCSISYLMLSADAHSLLHLLETLYLGFMLFQFYRLLREFVFFETLIKTDCLNAQPFFTGDTSEDLLDRQGSGLYARSGVILEPSDRRRQL